jgi:hypothetical protein
LTAEFDPDKYTDEYRVQVLGVIGRKAAGAEFELPAVADEKPKIVDMMAALEASVEAAKAARKRHPTTREMPAAGVSKKASARPKTTGAEDQEDRLTPAPAKQPRYRPDYRAGLADIVRRRAGSTFRQTLIFILRPMCSADLSEVLSWYPSSTVRNPSRCSCSLTASVAPAA